MKPPDTLLPLISPYFCCVTIDKIKILFYEKQSFLPVPRRTLFFISPGHLPTRASGV